MNKNVKGLLLFSLVINIITFSIIFIQEVNSIPNIIITLIKNPKNLNSSLLRTILITGASLLGIIFSAIGLTVFTDLSFTVLKKKKKFLLLSFLAMFYIFSSRFNIMNLGNLYSYIMFSLMISSLILSIVSYGQIKSQPKDERAEYQHKKDNYFDSF